MAEPAARWSVNAWAMALGVVTEEEQRQREEAARLAEEQRQRDEAGRREEQRRREEAARLAEERRQREEAASLAEEQRRRDETARFAEEQRRREEAARLVEERRQREVATKQQFLANVSRSRIASVAVEHNVTRGKSEAMGFAEFVLTGKVDVNAVNLGTQTGILIRVGLESVGLKDKECQLAAYFSLSGGERLQNTDGTYGTADGQVSCWEDFTLFDPDICSSRELFLPYEQMHLKGEVQHEIKCHIELFWKDSETFHSVAKSGDQYLVVNQIDKTLYSFSVGREQLYLANSSVDDREAVAARLRESLLQDPLNADLRKRYLAARTPAWQNADASFIPTWRFAACFGYFSIVGLLTGLVVGLLGGWIDGRLSGWVADVAWVENEQYWHWWKSVLVWSLPKLKWVVLLILKAVSGFVGGFLSA